MEQLPDSELESKPTGRCGQECSKNGSDVSVNNKGLILKVPAAVEDAPMCRICYSGPSRERLLKPCKCKGTIRYVHRNCLERWLESTSYETCELCNYHYTTKRTRKSFWQWCCQQDTRRDRRNFVCDCTCFLLLTPLGVGTFWLCTEGAVYYQRVKNSTLETVALIVLAFFLVMAYITWIVLCTRYHLTIWSRWRSHNWSVRIVDRPPSPSNASSDEELGPTPTTPKRTPFVVVGQPRGPPPRGQPREDGQRGSPLIVGHPRPSYEHAREDGEQRRVPHTSLSFTRFDELSSSLVIRRPPPDQIREDDDEQLRVPPHFMPHTSQGFTRIEEMSPSVDVGQPQRPLPPNQPREDGEQLRVPPHCMPHTSRVFTCFEELL